MIRTENFAMVGADTVADLHDWLRANHGQAASVWLVTAKKTDAARFIPRAQVLDALIAWGWIDGIMRKRDDGRTMQLISPRKMQVWAKTYQDRVARLRQDSRMEAPGEAAVQAAQAAGLWNALAHVDRLEVPEDLAAALGPVGPQFASLPPSYRRNVLRWIAGAKTPPTRAKRVAELVASTAKGERVPQY